MASTTRPGRGGTPNALTAKPSLKAVDGDKPGRPSSKDSLRQKVKKLEETPKASKSEEQLKTFKSDFDGLRGHLTCKICDRLLYQPYIISCGHTYCYSCLCTWFVNNKARKTCPDCRAVVTQPPAPAYLIRDMVNVFVNRTELLPSGETIEQHSTWQKEEADIVQQDKDNQDVRTGGLFKGCFRPARTVAPSLRAVRDREDGVDRCPLCSWELESGECAQCGLFFDENGELTWGDSFTGFSDLDEMSERDLSGEDLDAELEMEDGFDGFGEPMDGWPNYMEDENESFVMRRFFEHGIPPQAYLARRRMTHSEAGSRRSYSQSIVSDMYTDEMDTVEEEDEEGLDEDSSMNDFIDDDEEVNPESPSTASPAAGQTPQPSNNTRRVQGRARRVVESEASSTVSSVVEEDDEEDEGPIRRGQRSRVQARILNRANGSREPSGPPSSTSTEESHEQELDEDTQALLRADGWMLQHDGPDEEMDDDDDDDSDGARTTVGWDATAISNDRVRMGGSLTPTADRPRPNGTIRPPSRAGNPRIIDASRGLRRRSSVISNSTVSYEDGEADDDDSDLDQDGDITMAMNSLRQRRSRAQLRNPIGLNPTNPTARFANRGLSQGDAIDLDTDDNSDNSQTGGRRRGAPRVRHQEYNPRISWMFADHQRALQEFQRPGPLLDLDIEPRSITPVMRPRTSNRNRQSPAPQFSPFAPPRLRTPMMENTSNNTIVGRGLISPPRRIAASPLHRSTTPSNNPIRGDRAPSISSTSDASIILTPSTSGTSTPIIQQSVSVTSQEQTAATIDMIDRPPSRVGARPPSTTGRRNSAGFPPAFPSYPHHTNVGLNMQAAFLQDQRNGNNPWARFVRPRNSRPALRDQSSTATLRPATSRVNMRDSANQPQGVRSQPSRANLQHQPSRATLQHQTSRRRLNNQASTRTLRASEHARPPQSPGISVGPTSLPPTRSRLAPDERDNRARELVNDRLRALGGTYQPNTNPVRTNPFTQNRRPSIPSEVAPPTLGINNTPHHVRSNSNESVTSITSSTTAHMPPPSPNLGRRRSSRNMASAPIPPPAQGIFTSPVTMYTNNYMRPRQTALSNTGSPYESPLYPTTQRLSPMVAASGPLI